MSRLRVLNLLLSIFYFLIDRICRAVCRILGVQVPPVLVTVTYHSVKDDEVDKFIRQMGLLRRHASPVSTNSPAKGSVHSIRVVVTFDDGFENFLTNALPVLVRMRIPAVIFVPAALMGESPSWIDDQNHPNVKEKLLSPGQIREFPRDIVEIGSHTMTHPRLSFLESEDINREISESKAALERVLQRSVDVFSIPYGDYDNRVIDISRRAGYRHVYLNTPCVLIPKDDNFLQGRVDVGLKDWSLEFYMKIMGAYQWLALAIPLKRKILGFSRGILPKQVGDA